MKGELRDLYTVTYLGTEYLCRTVRGDDGRMWDMADSQLGEIISGHIDSDDSAVRDGALNVDENFYCYVPLHVLIFADDDKIMSWCRDNGIDFD